MRILVGHRGSVDFDGPLELNEQERQKFVEFIKTLFDPSVVELVPKKTPRWERLGPEKNFTRFWSRSECRLLLETDSNETLTEKLGRSWMSIVMQRGILLPDFDAWCAENGYTRKGDYRDLIEKYLEEKEFRKKQRRKRFQLLKCTQCGLLHLPEFFDQRGCYHCGGKLRVIHVHPDEKYQIYENQPRIGTRATSSFWEEFFRKYPPQKVEKSIT